MKKHAGKQIEGEGAAYKKLVEEVGETLLGIKDLCRKHGILTACGDCSSARGVA